MYVTDTWNYPRTFTSHQEALDKSQELARERAAANGGAATYEGVRSLVIVPVEDGLVFTQMRPTARTADGECLPVLEWAVQISTVHFADEDVLALAGAIKDRNKRAAASRRSQKRAAKAAEVSHVAV